MCMNVETEKGLKGEEEIGAWEHVPVNKVLANNVYLVIWKFIFSESVLYEIDSQI